MNTASQFNRNQWKQLALAWVRQTLRDRRSLMSVLIIFGGMSFGLAVLDVSVGWSGEYQSSASLMGGGVVVASLPVMALIGFANLAFLGTAVPLASYRADGILRHLGTTPVDRCRLLLTQLSSRLLLGLVQILVLILLAALFAPLTMAGITRVAVLMLAALLFLIAVGCLIGSRSSHPDRILASSLLLTIALIATSGIVLPLGLLPDPLGSLLMWLPTTLFAQTVMAEVLGTPLHALPFSGVVLLLLGCAVVLFIVSVRAFRWDSTEC